MIKVISFDMDGTLVDFGYVNSLFLEVIPKLIAEKRKTSVKEAKEFVLSEYGKLGRENVDWCRASYWFRHFGLSDYDKTVKDLIKNVNVYPDTVKVLQALNKKYTLVVLSSADTEMIKLRMKAAGIDKFFKKFYSSIDMFNELKTDKVFKAVLDDLKIKPEELLHVGDDPKYDFEAARKMKIRAFFVSRGDTPPHFGIDKTKIPKARTIKDLSELVKKLAEM